MVMMDRRSQLNPWQLTEAEQLILIGDHDATFSVQLLILFNASNFEAASFKCCYANVHK